MKYKLRLRTNIRYVLPFAEEGAEVCSITLAGDTPSASNPIQLVGFIGRESRDCLSWLILYGKILRINITLFSLQHRPSEGRHENWQKPGQGSPQPPPTTLPTPPKHRQLQKRSTTLLSCRPGSALCRVHGYSRVTKFNRHYESNLSG